MSLPWLQLMDFIPPRGGSVSVEAPTLKVQKNSWVSAEVRRSYNVPLFQGGLEAKRPPNQRLEWSPDDPLKSPVGKGGTISEG